VTTAGQAETDIEVKEGVTPIWVLAASTGRQTYDSLSGLLDALRNQSI